MRIEGKEIGVGNPPPTELFLLSKIFNTFLTVKLYVFGILINTYNPINKLVETNKTERMSTSSLFVVFGPTMNLSEKRTQYSNLFIELCMIISFLNKNLQLEKQPS